MERKTTAGYDDGNRTVTVATPLDGGRSGSAPMSLGGVSPRFRPPLSAQTETSRTPYECSLAGGLTKITLETAVSPQYCSLKDPDRLPDVERGQRLRMARAQGEVAHLALHAAEVSPVAARHDALLQDFIEDGVMKGFPVLRGE